LRAAYRWARSTEARQGDRGVGDTSSPGTTKVRWALAVARQHGTQLAYDTVLTRLAVALGVTNELALGARGLGP